MRMPIIWSMRLASDSSSAATLSTWWEYVAYITQPEISSRMRKAAAERKIKSRESEGCAQEFFIRPTTYAKDARHYRWFWIFRQRHEERAIATIVLLNRSNLRGFGLAG